MTQQEGDDWHAICRKGFLYCQRDGDEYKWVKTKEPEYFITSNNAMLINVLLESHTFSKAYVEDYPEEDWDGILSPIDLAMVVSLCHNVSIDDLELVRIDGERYPIRLSDEAKEVFHVLYYVLGPMTKRLADVFQED